MKNSHPRFWSTPTGWAALAMIAAVTYFLIFEHGHHVLQFLPYLILLLCPLMHIFMHSSHGKHGHVHEHSQGSDNKQKSFQELSDNNAAYRDGYIQGLEEGRKESLKKDNRDE
ncbi:MULTISPECIES: DUF2933 domain-containing protein [Alteromonas]|uniref:DUF2933 domain-containing protein n=1 Tax=Alteromonas halophila TaxID=516698 RepID=A0A918JSC3_9ALTE|nr:MULTISPECIES: DUF2933 domain-containing protein [Alteromonas]GFD67308.1 hypothetical protein KUL106_05710 [Alteromonas sp. KUL106]GFD78119.1 hypothetical protein KUL118_09810 [Tenacibaculum sp. KUL118]GGW97586.1 hypothetical protein GCM10007391_34500 [Alteromonas halophila]